MQFVLDDEEPGRHPPTILLRPRQHRKLACDARHLPRLSRADRAQCGRRHRIDARTLGHALLTIRPDAGREEARGQARGEGQAGRLQGTAADGAGQRHDEYPQSRQQALEAMARCRARCLVPFTSFSEFNKAEGGDIWFAFDETRPLAFFAGIWTNWTSVRKVKEGETTNDLFAFLTTEPNTEVGAIHPKAMPVILTKPEELTTWMNAPAEEAMQLQRPLPDGALKIIARGKKKDEAPAL